MMRDITTVIRLMQTQLLLEYLTQVIAVISLVIGFIKLLMALGLTTELILLLVTEVGGIILTELTSKQIG